MNLSDLKFVLANLGSAGDPDLKRTAARLATLSNLFFDQYGDGPVSLLRAPARISMLGEHIDYVSYLPTASLTFGSRERDALLLYRKSQEPVVRGLSSSAKYEPSGFSLLDAGAIRQFGNEVESEWLEFLFQHGVSKPHWQNYVEGAVTFARGKFGEQVDKGFDFALDSNIPAGGGASSSSALVVLGGVAIRDVNNISWTLSDLAKDSAMAEWFVGTRGGSMDHTTICLAQPANAVLINYADGQTKHVALPDKRFEWITFFSKPADKGREVMIEYNERAAVSRLLIPALIENWKLEAPERHRTWHETLTLLTNGSSDAFEATQTLLAALPETISIDTIRERYPATFSELERSFPALLNETSRWPLKIRIRSLHHLGEVKRVALATDTLKSIEESSEHTFSAMETIGKLLNESHASLCELYEVSAPEVDELIGIIRDDEQVLGARLMGGGFGGNVLVLTTRDHTQKLIQRVQEHYYSPRDRDGVREGSVMVSTPGPGLAHLDLGTLWRAAIARLSSAESRAATQITNLHTLIDTMPVSIDSRAIWPVIVAAGKGTRASETGLKQPKPVAVVGEDPSIVHVLRNIREALGETPPPVIIVSPDTEDVIRETLRGEDVLFVTQPRALGTGDAVLSAHELLRDFSGTTLIAWSTQPVIRAKTFSRAAKLAQLFHSYEMVVPTAFVERPYAPIRRDESGRIASASETHLESAQTIEFGETNIGVFVVKNQTLFEVLLDLRRRYWNDATGSYDRSRGELGFPNEVISALAKRDSGVFASPFADPREEQGIKRLENLSRCERFISELEQEETEDSDLI